MADINKIINTESSDSQISENVVNETIVEESKTAQTVVESPAITKDQEAVIDKERLENANIAIAAKENNIPVSKDPEKPLIEQNNFVENTFQWFKDKQAQNQKQYEIRYSR